MIDEESWDPLGDHYNSLRNTLAFTIDEPGFAQEKLEDIPCPHQKEPNKPCFKGSRCPHKHGQYTAQTLYSHPKLSSCPRTTNVILADASLPPKHNPTDGFISLAWITTVVDPWEFYVVLKDSSHCLCGSEVGMLNEESKKDEGQSSRTSGFEQLQNLWTSMQSHYETTQFSDQHSQYFSGELVAVRLCISGGKWGWFRAVVMQDTDTDYLDEDPAPFALLKLLDYGLDVKKSVLELRPLDQKFANFSSLVFKCSLYGISPLLGTWGRKGSNFFKKLVSGQLVILEVKQAIVRNDETFENTGMQVKLYVKKDGQTLNVTKTMADLGLGIEWNPFPKAEPIANFLLPSPQYEFAINEQWKDC